MHTEDKVNLFSQWGNLLKHSLDSPAFTKQIERASLKNPWFTHDNIQLALQAIIDKMLNKASLEKWAAMYSLPAESSRTIGLVMAGNIPLAGFHDLLCCLMAGHNVQIKLSSKDTVLLPALLEELYALEPAYKEHITFPDLLKGFDAVIATGSNNSARYFEYYFSKYPGIIRKNRNSAAILTGDESRQELQALATDVFTYFGLGCRNVSALMVPEGYDFDNLFKAFESRKEIIHHNKYKNNYDYNKSLLLLNREKHLDTGFLLLEEKPESLSSPMATLYYTQYKKTQDAIDLLQKQRGNIQCIATKQNENSLPAVDLGKTQYPELWEYADDVDTLEFLTKGTQASGNS